MKLKPFRGLRPVPDRVALIACRPYDVLDSAEARAEAADNPFSFLNVVKPEITLSPDVDPYAPQVYAAGRYYFQELLNEGVFFQDRTDCLYLYELTMDGRSQAGIVACASIEEYLSGLIKQHELTRPDKELDRQRHIEVSMLNAEPVFLTYRAQAGLDRLVDQIRRQRTEYDFTSGDGVRHRFWLVSDPSLVGEIVARFRDVATGYVADGHHRSAAAAKVGLELRNQNPAHTGDEEYNYFLAVWFPDNQLRIMDYNRVVRDLNGLSPEAFVAALAEAFSVEQVSRDACRPDSHHCMGMYLAGTWYRLRARAAAVPDTDPVASLDVTLLSEQILKPLLGIQDLRTDERIEFIGGIRGLGELERLVDSGRMAAAFAMFPVSLQQLMAVADSGSIMPPKVTWFEPKLRSGLVVHSLND